MITKRQLRKQTCILENRVHELEEIICPCEDHIWKKIKYRNIYGYSNILGSAIEYTYICTKCKKIRKETEL